MKKTILFTIYLMLGISAFAQNNALTSILPNFNFYARGLGFYVEPRYNITVNKEILNSANDVSDIIADYPSNWISEYVSVVIKVTSNGEILEATSTNEKLISEQKRILKSANLGSEISVQVNYKNNDSEASLNNNNPKINETKTITLKMTVTPETDIEAKFTGGNELMNTYLMENAIHKISGVVARKIKTAQVTFTVTEAGKIENVQLSKTSNDPATDELLVNVIANMPKWQPARNSKGKAVKQEFKFSVSDYGC